MDDISLILKDKDERLDAEAKLPLSYKGILNYLNGNTIYGRNSSVYVSGNANYDVAPEVENEIDPLKAEILATASQKALYDASDGSEKFSRIIYADLGGNVYGATVVDTEDRKYLILNYKLVHQNDEYMKDMGLNPESPEELYEIILHEVGHAAAGIPVDKEFVEKYHPNKAEEMIMRAIHEGMNSLYTSIAGSDIEPYKLYQEMVKEIDDGNIEEVLDEYFAHAVGIIDDKEVHLIFPRIPYKYDYLPEILGLRDVEYMPLNEVIRMDVIEEFYRKLKESYEEMRDRMNDNRSDLQRAAL